MIHRVRIFVSASGDQHLDSNQTSVKRVILAKMKDRNFELLRYFEKGPLRKGWGFDKANEAMAQSDGAIVLAFAQWECKGLGPRIAERGGLKVSEGNHLEGGLAIAHDVPLLVVREDGSQDRGIVSEGTNHTVVIMPRASPPDWVDSGAFMRGFHNWCGDIEQSLQAEREKRVFIGHGGSLVWKILRDYIVDKLGLPWDEFNRVPAAGIATVNRLSQMLDEAGIAFLVMTAED